MSFEIIQSRYTVLDGLDVDRLNAFFDTMSAEARAVVRAGTQAPITELRVAFMRYHGQGHEIEIPLPSRALTGDDIDGLRQAFEVEYSRQFSRTVPGMTVEILNWALSAASEAPPSGRARARCRPSPRRKGGR